MSPDMNRRSVLAAAVTGFAGSALSLSWSGRATAVETSVDTTLALDVDGWTQFRTNAANAGYRAGAGDGCWSRATRTGRLSTSRTRSLRSRAVEFSPLSPSS